MGVAVWNGETTEGAEIKQYENTGADDQKWAIEFVEYRGEGAERKAYYKIINYNSKLVLTALGESDNYSLTQQLYKHTDDQLWTLNLVGGEWNDPTWDTAEADENGTAIIYQGNEATDYRCGVIYGRGLQLQADPESEYYGKIYATSEYYQSGRWDGNEHFRFYESSDNGETWQFVGDLYDTENNREKYKGSMWSMRHQPDLYELPEDLGDLKKGTIICAGLTTSNDTTAKTDSDYDGSKYTRIDLYYSTDGCRSWNFLGHVTDGGESRCGYASAIWELYLYTADGKLYCFYSDERGIDQGQKLVAQSSSDGKTWSEAFDVVNFTEENEAYRPGMPIVTQMSDGRYVIVYEEYAMNRDGSNKLRSSYKITDDIENWNADEHGTIMPWSDGGSPYIATMNDGTLVCGNLNSSDIYINTNNLSTNEWTSVYTGQQKSYTRCYKPLLNGKLLVISSAGSYGAPVTSTLSSGTVTMVRANIINKSGAALSIDNESTTAGATAVGSPVSDSPSQEWMITYNEDKTVQFTNVNSSLCMGVYEGSVNSGEKAVQWQDLNNDDQCWLLESVDENLYKIVNKNSGMVLTLNSDNTVVQKEYTGDDSQLWNISEIDNTEPSLPETQTKVTSSDSMYILSTALLNVSAGNTIIIAAYDTDGKIVSVKYDVTDSNTVTTEFDKENNISYFKVMVWESLKGMIPITRCKSYSAAQ